MQKIPVSYTYTNLWLIGENFWSDYVVAGQTPLHMACTRHAMVVRGLLEHGADPKAVMSSKFVLITLPSCSC